MSTVQLPPEVLALVKGWLSSIGKPPGPGVNDREGNFNKILAILAKLPPDSDLAKQMNNGVIQLLYNTIPHPPATSVGPEHRFRHADGSHNNPWKPELGQAGQPYTRSVQGKQPLPLQGLPETSLIYDELLKASEHRDDHPGKNSSLTFSFASIVTHSLFRTGLIDWNKNNTSSYLDLSPVYGSNQVEQDAVRNKDGRGQLYPDSFSESRLTLLPAPTSCILVLFSRNHNFIADNLLRINERGKWSDPSAVADERRKLEQDEEIFQTARLVNCGAFMSVILGDYVAGFLGLGRDGISWSMKPFDPILNSDGTTVSRGEGNQVSVEFNLLYRWHAVTSEADEEWTKNVFKDIFQGKPFNELQISDFKAAMGRLTGRVPNYNQESAFRIDPDPRHRTFGGLKRGPDGRFSDSDIARVLQDATENPAKRYGARGSPEVFKVIEIMGMEQARQWGVCSMNEFRLFLGLRPYKSFEEWNPDPVIAAAAKRLYHHIDRLELYPGLHAEETAKLGPGSGLCAGYTTTRGILSDAIALVRGDRFLTTDFTPANLTSWGIQDVTRDPNNGAYGAYLPKLLMRTLPRHYPWNSAYSLFPFFMPSVTRTNLEKLNVADKYTFDRPKEAPIPKAVNTFTAIKYVSNDIKKFKVIYDPDLRRLTHNAGMFLGFDEQPKHKDDRQLGMHALFSPGSFDEYASFYRDTTKELIASRTFRYDNSPGNHLDVIRDVINVVAIRWSCETICGTPTLGPTATSANDMTDQDAYGLLATLFQAVFRNTEPSVGWALREQAKSASDKFWAIIEANIIKLRNGDESNLTPACARFLKQLIASERTNDQLCGLVIGLLVGSSVNYAQAVAQMVDFYLDEKRSKEKKHIIELCSKDDPESKELLVGYYREAARLNPQFPALLRISVVSETIDQGPGHPPVTVKPGDRIFCSYLNAHANPVEFPDPETVNPSRPKESYSIQATGTHGCPGLDFSELTIPEIVKPIFTLPNIRRAPGFQGALTSFNVNLLGTETKVYVNELGVPSAWPTSLVVVYDDGPEGCVVCS